jgi:magnesium-transporting ATPase (P-type)
MVPAMALGAELPEPGIMDLPPRSRRERLLSMKVLLHSLLFLGLIEAFAGLFGYFWGNYLSGWRPGLMLAPPGTSAYVLATTMTLVAIVMTQVGNVIACKTDRLSILKVDFLANRLVFVGLAVELSIILLVVYVPFLNWVFGTAPLSGREWFVLFLFAPLILILEELRKYFVNRRGRTEIV